MEIRDKIRRLMEEKEWNPGEFSRQTGISESAVRSWLSGESLPSERSLCRVAEAFGLSLAALYGGDAADAETGELLWHWYLLEPEAKKAVLYLVRGLKK